MLTRWRLLPAATAAILSAAVLAGTGTVPAHASTPDASLVLQASRSCSLYAPGHNVQLIVECNSSTTRETWHDIRGAGFYDPVAHRRRTAYELEITSGPAAVVGLCLNDDASGGTGVGDAVAADSCQPTRADRNEYFWVDPTKIADTHWYRNVIATDDWVDTGESGYWYLTDFAACIDNDAVTNDTVSDTAGGCGGYGAWTAITS